ncbi:MAG: F0F1 ATP synthase subunit alpha [Chitinispirillaceae bacterium]|jgi:F-type H+-transporting ATPase subunit alpha
MAIDSSQITGILRETLKSYETKLDLRETGYVMQIGDGIARVYGLDRAVYGELVSFPHEVFGMVLNLENDSVGCILFGDAVKIKEGDEVSRTGRVMAVPVGEALLGRVVNPLGEPLDGKGDIKAKTTRPIEVIAPGVMERQPVKEPLQTGIKAIDSMIPIGRGQRELIIGDRQIGKTAIVVDTIINQKNEARRPICIYVAVGQKQSTVAQIVDIFARHNALEYTVVVSCTASDAASLQYIAPYAGCAIGEEFMWQGKDVLVVYDDLTRHAQAYRQLSLLLRRPPGREAYPGDVFYLHSRLLERACKLSEKNGSGSLTALPIIETQAGDISAYIPTNVISITDGQIFLERGLFFTGQRPAINSGLSVSRVGGNAQIKAMRQVAGRVRLDLAQYRELAAFAQFASELDSHSQTQLARGERLMELLKQDQYQPLSVEIQIAIIFAGVNGFIDDVAIPNIRRWETDYIAYLSGKQSGLLADIKSKKQIDDGIKARLEEAIKEFKGKKA